MGVTAAIGGDDPVPDRGDRLRHSIQCLQRSGEVVVDVAVVGVGLRGLAVPGDRLLVIAASGVFLGDPVQAEGVVGILLEEGHQAGESVWRGHGRILREHAPDGNSSRAPDGRMAYPRLMRNSHRSRSHLLTVLSGLLVVMTGCQPSYAPKRTIDLRPRILEVVNQHGGNRRVMVHLDEHWYQSFGPEIEVIDSEDGLRITTLEPGPWGTVPPVSDLMISPEGDLLAVHAFDRVARYDLENPRRPVLVREYDAESLGVLPLFLSEEGGRVWVSGRGGATPLGSDGVVVLDDLGDDISIGRVVGGEEGIVATVGRRILGVEDGRYFGAASELRPIPTAIAEKVGLPGGLVFILRGSEASTVGIMGPDLRERDRQVYRANVQSARVLGDRLWAVMPTEIVTWPLEEGGRLGSPQFIPIKGARDIGMVAPNYYAVCGTFGRAIYRFKADSTGDADEFIAVERTPGLMVAAATDGRRVLAGSDEGNWIYRIGGKVELTDRPLRNDTPPKRKVTTTWGEATVEEDGRVLRIDALQVEPFEWRCPWNGRIMTLEAADDRVFVGHDFGVECFGFRNERVDRVGGIVLEGPVAWLFRPRVGDEVAFVSIFGGLGTVEVVPDPDADQSLVRRVRPEEAAEAQKEMREGRRPAGGR